MTGQPDIAKNWHDVTGNTVPCGRNAEMCAPASILISTAVAVASFTAHETIGLTLGITGVIASFVWRSDLMAKSIARTERRSALRRALNSLIPDSPL
jgi:hypothetical protein